MSLAAACYLPYYASPLALVDDVLAVFALPLGL